MPSNDHRTQQMLIRRSEIESKVLDALRENGDGLTSSQIAKLTGMRVRRDILMHLRKAGKVKTRKGISKDGSIAFLYLLNESNQNSQTK